MKKTVQLWIVQTHTGDGQFPGHARIRLMDPLPDQRILFQQGIGAVQQDLSRRGERDLTVIPDQKFCSQLAFQRSDVTAQGGLTDIQNICRLREVQQVCHDLKVVKLFKCHDITKTDEVKTS